MAAPLHRIKFAADPVRSLAERDQRLMDAIVIQSALRPRSRTDHRRPVSQQPHSVLPMKAAHRNEFIENARLSARALRHRVHQLIPRPCLLALLLPLHCRQQIR
ncbi:hypothetical protein X732_30770 [Mesorhizobium sp. L2C066B000]|nr:hypothetical protein X732_30770 [Mesorhizobium sp. L2C066B000]